MLRQCDCVRLRHLLRRCCCSARSALRAGQGHLPGPRPARSSATPASTVTTPTRRRPASTCRSYAGAMAGGEQRARWSSPATRTAACCTGSSRTPKSRRCRPRADKLPDKDLDTIKKWIAGGLLETAGSTAVASNKPKVDLKVAADAPASPTGPPPMPGDLLLEPVAAHAAGRARCWRWRPARGRRSSRVGGQKQVLLYNPQTLELLGVLPFPEGVPERPEVQPQRQAAARRRRRRRPRRGKVVLFDVTTGNRVTEVGDEFDAVLAADISPDQSLVALGGPGKRREDLLDRERRDASSTIKKHTDWVTAIALSPDGVLLATGDRNGGLFVWEARPAQRVLQPRRPQGRRHRRSRSAATPTCSPPPARTATSSCGTWPAASRSRR